MQVLILQVHRSIHCVDYFFSKKKPTLKAISLNKGCEIESGKGQKVSGFTNNFIYNDNNKILILSSRL